MGVPDPADTPEPPVTAATSMDQTDPDHCDHCGLLVCTWSPCCEAWEQEQAAEPAFTDSLGVSAVVRVRRDVLRYPAGTIGLVTRQARNGPNRYAVMIPGDPFEYSVAAKDLEVVQGVERWWHRDRAGTAPGTGQARESGPVYPQVWCDDSSGPNGIGGTCVLGPGHLHRDGLGGEWPVEPLGNPT